MAQRTTLAALAAEVAEIKALLERRDRRDVEVEKQVEGFLARRTAEHEQVQPAVERRKRLLRVIPGSAKLRTKRRGRLRLIVSA